MQELVEIWTKNRPTIFEFAKTARNDVNAETVENDRPKKRRKLDNKPIIVQKGGLEERRSTRSHSKRVASQASQSIQSVPSTQEEIADSEGGSVYADSPRVDSRHFGAIEPNDGLVGCPNCTRRMKEALINPHLDKCLQGLAGSPTPPPTTTEPIGAPSPSRGFQAGTIAYTTTKPNNSTLQRLSTINYGGMNEANLRRRLKDLGIPNHGNKELMRKRHSEWMNLWNANCDSLRPVPKAKLLRDLDVWERNFSRDERQRQQSAAGGSVNGNGVMDKDFDREGHMQKEKDGFEALVRKARESRMAKALVNGSNEPNHSTPSEKQVVDDDVSNPPMLQNVDRTQPDHQPPAPTSTILDRDTAMTNGDLVQSHNEEHRNHQDSNVPEMLVPTTPPPALKYSSMAQQPFSTGYVDPGMNPRSQPEPIDLVSPEKPGDAFR